MSTQPPPPVWPPDTPTQHHEDTQAQQHADAAPPTPISEAERATERTAFAELLAFITAHKGAGTDVAHVSADEYATSLE